VLVMYDSNSKPVARYHLENAWPSKIDVGSLDASKTEISIETLEISHEGLRLDTGANAAGSDEIAGTVSFGGRQMRAALFLCPDCLRP
jgi:T4-like virus tail tube protein gp19